MLRIYEVMLDCLVMLRPVVAVLERRDPDLARQLKKASSSVVLNCAEGMGSRGGNQVNRYNSSLGSARETLACVDIAERLYEAPRDAVLRSSLEQIIGTMTKLVR